MIGRKGAKIERKIAKLVKMSESFKQSKEQDLIWDVNLLKLEFESYRQNVDEIVEESLDKDIEIRNLNTQIKEYDEALLT